MEIEEVHFSCPKCRRIVTFPIELEEKSYVTLNSYFPLPSRVAVALYGKAKECECGYIVTLDISTERISVTAR